MEGFPAYLSMIASFTLPFPLVLPPLFPSAPGDRALLGERDSQATRSDPCIWHRPVNVEGLVPIGNAKSFSGGEMGPLMMKGAPPSPTDLPARAGVGPGNDST
jgi:hypothetical protein